MCWRSVCLPQICCSAVSSSPSHTFTQHRLIKSHLIYLSPVFTQKFLKQQLNMLNNPVTDFRCACFMVPSLVNYPRPLTTLQIHCCSCKGNCNKHKTSRVFFDFVIVERNCQVTKINKVSMVTADCFSLTFYQPHHKESRLHQAKRFFGRHLWDVDGKVFFLKWDSECDVWLTHKILDISVILMV